MQQHFFEGLSALHQISLIHSILITHLKGFGCNWYTYLGGREGSTTMMSGVWSIVVGRSGPKCQCRYLFIFGPSPAPAPPLQVLWSTPSKGGDCKYEATPLNTSVRPQLSLLHPSTTTDLIPTASMMIFFPSLDTYPKVMCTFEVWDQDWLLNQVLFARSLCSFFAATLQCCPHIFAYHWPQVHCSWMLLKWPCTQLPVWSEKYEWGKFKIQRLRNITF